MTATDTHTPFDPSDPFDASADMIRRGVVDVVLAAHKTTIFRELPNDKQLECLMSGLLVASIGCLLCFVKDENHDEFLREIATWLPSIQEQAIDIMTDGERGLH